jgi:hypothetical protein
VTDRFDLGAARLAFSRREVEAMTERLYVAALTVSSLPSGRPSGGSSWPATLRDYGDVLGALQPGALADGRLETATEVAARVEAQRRRPRFAPTGRQIDACMPTLELLRGVGSAGLWRYEARLAVAEQTRDETARRLEEVASGAAPCASDRREAVLARLAREHAAASHKAARAAAARDRAEAEGIGRGRAVLGALKGAGTVWWLGAPRVGLSKWDYAKSWSGAETPAAARALHDLGVYWALTQAQRIERRTP